MSRARQRESPLLEREEGVKQLGGGRAAQRPHQRRIPHHGMGGHGGYSSGSQHRHHRPTLSSSDGDLFSESELLGRACPGFPSSSSFPCCCCCCRCCWSPSSEPELDDRTAGSRSVIDDDGGDGAWGGDHGAVAGGEAHSSGAGGEGMRNMGNSTVPLPEEPASSVDRARWNALACTEVDISRWRQRRTYLELLRSYHDSDSGRLALLAEAKDAILRYTPGKSIEKVGSATPRKYRVPSATTLLLVGPQGSGKSSLVNRISRFLEDNPLLPDRAQVFHNISTVEWTQSMQEHMIPRGTYFLQEYMIPRDSASFCVYDTRGLSKDASENFYILKRWMNEGVRHGEMVLRDKDLSFVKSRIKAMARDMQCPLLVRRRVNFVIFVVDGISVLKTIYSLNKDYTNMLVETFNYSFMSFKDNKPAVVVTHGDLLSFHERALVCTHLGELLGIPATKQIFDIPDLSCSMTQSAIADLLHYCLEQADRNIPLTSDVLEGTRLVRWMLKGFQYFETWILILELVFIFICALIFSTQVLGKLVKLH